MSEAIGIIESIDIPSNTAYMVSDYAAGSPNAIRLENLAEPIQVGDIVTRDMLEESLGVASGTGISLRGDLTDVRIGHENPFPQPSIFAPPNPSPFDRHYPGQWNIPTEPDKMKVNAIAAIGEDNQLALNNRLPWRYPEDLELYHNKVRGHTVVMGRATFESIPASFYSIPDNIIIVSSTIEERDEDNIHVADTLEEAIGIADDIESKEVWICGGVGIYKEALKRELLDELHISHIPYEGEADRYFPNFTKYIYEVREGTTIECEDQASFVYKIYDMKDKSAILIDYMSEHSPGLRGLSANAVYVDDNINFSADNVQAALEELERNSGQPNTMMVNPEQYRQLVNQSAVSLSYTTEEEARNVGDTYYDSSNQAMYIMTEDGPIELGDTTVSDNSMETELQFICNDVANDVLYQNGMVTLGEQTYRALIDRLQERIRRIDPEATVECNLSVDNHVQPIYTMGEYAPVDFASGAPTARLDVTVGILYNTYNFSFTFN